MKSHFRSPFGWAIVPSLLLATFVFQGVGRTQPPPLTTGSIYVNTTVELYNATTRNRVYFYSFATLFKNGEPVKSGEVSTTNNGDLVWNNVPQGVYELHFESHGYGKVIKRVVVSPGERTPVVLAEVSKQDEAMGMGPTVFELQRKVSLLESRMSKIEKGEK